MNNIAVVTSTIGRDTLRQTIESVKNQSVACTHYVFVHGKEFWSKSKVILTDYPDVEAIYLPHNNGSNGYGMAPVFSMAPFIVSEQLICYLDDDNWIEPTHCENSYNLILINDLAWAFSLRKIVNNEGNYLCEDDCESIGLYRNIYNTHLVDNSCYAIKTDVARKHAHMWCHQPLICDRVFLAELMKHQLPCACTGASTANYRLSADGSHSMNADAFIRGNAAMHELFPNGLPWRVPTLFNVPQPKD